MRMLKLIKYQIKSQKSFYIIFLIVLNIFVFCFYHYGNEIGPKNNSAVENFLGGVALSYLLATLSLLILHIVMHFKLLSSGKKYLIFGSSNASAESIFFARIVNYVLDLMFTKAYLLLLLFAMNMVDERLCCKYWWWILFFNKHSDIKTNFGVVLIDLSFVASLNLWMYLGIVFMCWNNRHRDNIVDTVMNILAVYLIIISGFTGSGPINMIQRVIHSSSLLNITVVAFTFIVIVLYAKSSISRMKNRMDL
ncbi:hypothetical protein [Anaerocellum danielii]|uniref:Uncharacterized protein n=1 Tax=Anaerocellum danielii TaxID=1387557 RepID=A0ABZ0U015_9FIRM|nr:hypothetical protein [Caldicellulosiruptor danielii]WPX09066.1 hypothetical protein SOJ16_000240 [Caldicellulosiruptor danielii]